LVRLLLTHAQQERIRRCCPARSATLVARQPAIGCLLKRSSGSCVPERSGAICLTRLASGARCRSASTDGCLRACSRGFSRRCRTIPISSTRSSTGRSSRFTGTVPAQMYGPPMLQVLHRESASVCTNICAGPSSSRKGYKLRTAAEIEEVRIARGDLIFGDREGVLIVPAEVESEAVSWCALLAGARRCRKAVAAQDVNSIYAFESGQSIAPTTSSFSEDDSAMRQIWISKSGWLLL
jgi:hypothetical protein